MRENVSISDEMKQKTIFYFTNAFAGDQCPMYFDDGSYPWTNTENYIKIFNWDFVRSSAAHQLPFTFLILSSVYIVL